MKWLGLALWLLLCYGVAGLGARWTTPEIPGWYRTLMRPSFAPPNWIFGPVWTLLYTLMAVAVWRVSLAPPSTARSLGILLFVIQLALNLAWSQIFFKQHWIGAAFAEVLCIWAAIGGTILLFWRVSPLGGALLLPYIVWVSFASVLNGAYWRLNS